MHFHTVEYYRAIKRNEVLVMCYIDDIWIHYAKKPVMYCMVRPHSGWFHTFEMSRIGKSVEKVDYWSLSTLQGGSGGYQASRETEQGGDMCQKLIAGKWLRWLLGSARQVQSPQGKSSGSAQLRCLGRSWSHSPQVEFLLRGNLTSTVRPFNWPFSPFTLKSANYGL